MITNERQYRITKAELERLQRSLDEIAKSECDVNIHPLLVKAEQEGINSQINDLQNEVKSYEELRSGHFILPTLDSFSDFPMVLIKARISKGLTQKELAERLGLKEQQIQKYESTGYSSASLSKLKEVAAALGLPQEDRATRNVSKPPLMELLNKLQEIGIDRDLILQRIAPVNAENGQVEDQYSLAAKIADMVGRIFGWEPKDVLKLGSSQLTLALPGARLKAATNANMKRVNAYLVYAHYLALTLVPAIKNPHNKSIIDDPYKMQATIIEKYGSLNLSNSTNFLWDSGMLVLPLNNSGAFHGAYFREHDRHMIVLKQKTFSDSRWMFDAFHEAYHSVQEPEQSTLVVIEHSDMSEERKKESEIIASQYAGAVLLGQNPNKLADLCIEEAKQDILYLKSAVKKVARVKKVPVDSLANFVAFHLSMNGENWWGTAANLQSTQNNPFETVKRILLERIDLSRLSDQDGGLIKRAIFQ